MIKKFQTKTFKKKSAVERLRLVDDATAQIEIDLIGVVSRVQAAVIAKDEDERRRANRELVSLSVFADQLKLLRRQAIAEQRGPRPKRRSAEDRDTNGSSETPVKSNKTSVSEAL